MLQSHGKQNKTHGGSNKEKIMLNIKTFILFCLKSGTKKSNEIHEYYINLEEAVGAIRAHVALAQRIILELIHYEFERLRLDSNASA